MAKVKNSPTKAFSVSFHDRFGNHGNEFLFSADKFGRINFENFRDLISVNYAALATFDTIVNRIVEAESAFESEWSEGLYTDKYFVSVRRMHEKLKVHILLNSDESDTILEIYLKLTVCTSVITILYYSSQLTYDNRTIDKFIRILSS